MTSQRARLLSQTSALASPSPSALNGSMNAENFEFTPSMQGDRCKMHVRHKFTGRTWEREFDEGEWLTVRVELLATIQTDLETPAAEASSP